jgi:hypothetical protein
VLLFLIAVELLHVSLVVLTFVLGVNYLQLLGCNVFILAAAIKDVLHIAAIYMIESLAKLLEGNSLVVFSGDDRDAVVLVVAAFLFGDSVQVLFGLHLFSLTLSQSMKH